MKLLITSKIGSPKISSKAINRTRHLLLKFSNSNIKITYASEKCFCILVSSKTY